MAVAGWLVVLIVAVFSVAGYQQLYRQSECKNTQELIIVVGLVVRIGCFIQHGGQVALRF